jgi:hypothetical protein
MVDETDQSKIGGTRVHLDLGAANARYDPDICPLEPVRRNQHRACITGNFLPEPVDLIEGLMLYRGPSFARSAALTSSRVTSERGTVTVNMSRPHFMSRRNDATTPDARNQPTPIVLSGLSI